VLDGASRAPPLVGEVEHPAVQPVDWSRACSPPGLQAPPFTAGPPDCSPVTTADGSGRGRCGDSLARDARSSVPRRGGPPSAQAARPTPCSSASPGEDRLAVDILVGDLVWETSCSLPGEGGAAQGPGRPHPWTGPPGARPPGGSWTVGDPVRGAGRRRARDRPGGRAPGTQRLASRPPVEQILAVLPRPEPRTSAPTGSSDRARVIEESYHGDLIDRQIAVEVAYEGGLPA